MDLHNTAYGFSMKFVTLILIWVFWRQRRYDKKLLKTFIEGFNLDRAVGGIISDETIHRFVVSLYFLKAEVCAIRAIVKTIGGINSSKKIVKCFSIERRKSKNEVSDYNCHRSLKQP